MQVRKLAAPVELGAHLAANFHDVLEHLVVAIPCEEYFAGIELVKSAANGPHVDRIVIRHAENDFRCSIESTHKVRGDVVVCCRSIRLVDSCSQIADLEDVASLIDLYPSQSKSQVRKIQGAGLPEYCQASNRRG